MDLVGVVVIRLQFAKGAPEEVLTLLKCVMTP